MIILLTILGIHNINPMLNATESFSYTTPCTISVEGCESFHIILPVRATLWNLHQGQGDQGLGVDTLRFCATSSALGVDVTAREMGVGPPRSVYRYRSQTTLSCCDQKSWW
ncbi:MAG: hypothetical protein KAR40_17690 [Candidatus Sabulitectum sp.]|nr:hypothetical protein [Candidatus Sabulitectum sp.]